MTTRHFWVCCRLALGIVVWGSLGVVAMVLTAVLGQAVRSPVELAGFLLVGLGACAAFVLLAMLSASKLQAQLEVDSSVEPPREWMWGRLNRECMWVLPASEDPSYYAGMREAEREEMHAAICRRLLSQAEKILRPYGGRVEGVQVVVRPEGAARSWTPEAYAEVRRRLAGIRDGDLRPTRRRVRVGSR